MNGIIKLTDGIATIENGIITSDNIITSNIITDDINLNVGDGKHLSVFDDLNNKAYYTDILSLSGIIYNYENIKNNNVNIINSEIITLSSTIYNNYNNTLATQYSIFNTLINNENTIYSYGYSISGNLKSANCLSHFIITYISYSFSVAQPTLNIFPPDLNTLCKIPESAQLNKLFLAVVILRL